MRAPANIDITWLGAHVNLYSCGGTQNETILTNTHILFLAQYWHKLYAKTAFVFSPFDFSLHVHMISGHREVKL